jgi:hypothetical protein
LHGPEEAAAVPVFDANIDGRVEGIGCDPLKEGWLWALVVGFDRTIFGNPIFDT